MSKSISLPLLLSILLVACAAPATATRAPATASPSTASAEAPPRGPQPLPSPIGEYASERQPDDTFRFRPISARVLAGVVYGYAAFTHCGFTPITFDFDGSFWELANPAPEAGPNPPPGIGNPEDQGTIALVGPNEAVFTAASGILVPLRRGEGPRDTFPCD